MTDELITEETSAPPTGDAPFTEAEKLDLVKLLDADPAPVRYYLPEGENDSKELFIEAKAWTGLDEIRYEGAGMDYRTPIAGKGKAAPTEARFRMDRVEQMEMLINSSITDFFLRVRGRVVQFQRGQKPWEIFKTLPAPVLEWVEKTLRQHHGIEVVSGEV